MTCKKANLLTDINLAGKVSLHLDYSNLRYNATVQNIRTDSDALRDALSTKDGAWSMFKQWKNNVHNYELISPEEYSKKVQDGTVAFTTHANPEQALYNAISELD